MTQMQILKIILDKVSYIEQKITHVEQKLDENINETKENGERITKLGLQLAELEDDAPTVDEFGLLEERVAKLERPSNN